MNPLPFAPSGNPKRHLGLQNDTVSDKYKIDKGYYDEEGIWSDEEVEWWEREVRKYEKNKLHPTVYQWRKIMGFVHEDKEAVGRLDKEAIKEKSDIVEVYQLLHPNLKIVEKGDFITAQAFCHDDQRPSLSINKKKQVYFCHVDQEGGDVLTLVMKSLGVSFLEALNWLNNI